MDKHVGSLVTYFVVGVSHEVIRLDCLSPSAVAAFETAVRVAESTHRLYLRMQPIICCASRKSSLSRGAISL